MKLRTKTWIVVLAALAVTVALMLAIASRTVLRSFGSLEHEQLVRDVERVQGLLTRQTDEVERIARDYGEWGDTVLYARGEMPDYPTENWLGDSLENLRVNTMLVFTVEGRLAGGVLHAPGTEATTPADPDFAGTFARDVDAVLGDAAGATRPRGARLIAGEPWMIACVPLLEPDSDGRPAGALVVGRRMDGAFTTEISTLARLPVAMHAGGMDEEPGVSDMRFDSIDQGGVLVARPTDDTLVAHIPVRDPSGAAIATLHVVLDRPIHAEAGRTVLLIVLQSAGIALLCGVVFHMLLGRAVVSRVEAMHAAINRVGKKDDLSVRVPARGDDEIAGLGQALNTMLDTLARSRGEREAAHREREKLNEQLVQAQKMEALGDFAGGIAHDFNNCLTTITGWVSMVREDLPEDSEHRENLGLALASATHASAVVRQLLVYSRQGEPTLAAVSLRDVLASSLQLLRSALPKSIQLNLATTGDDDVVLADATQLKQIVLNLAKNAADAIDPPGRITLSLSAITLPSSDAPGQAGSLPSGRYAHLTVHDTGTGIHPEHLERIFDPFFTTKPAGKGTGLGLAVVRSVVLRHRGAVAVTSPPGDGATFHVYLPLHAEAAVAAPIDAGPPPTGCRVLVVDDDAGVLRVIARLVTNFGYTVTTASHGLEAWDLFTSAPQPFEIVLTDLTMPHLGGMQLGERIFNSDRPAAVVLMSAYASTLDPAQLRRAGFADLLPKPVDSASLRLTLARARQVAERRR
ncbi:MAG: response regulator [Opitutaceae bacterium]|nr:response regulator [Opitutaceae bacterium]